MRKKQTWKHPPHSWQKQDINPFTASIPLSHLEDRNFIFCSRGISTLFSFTILSSLSKSLVIFQTFSPIFLLSQTPAPNPMTICFPLVAITYIGQSTHSFLDTVDNLFFRVRANIHICSKPRMTILQCDVEDERREPAVAKFQDSV